MEDAMGRGLSPLDVPPHRSPPFQKEPHLSSTSGSPKRPDPSGAAESTNHMLNSFKSVREMILPRLRWDVSSWA